MTVQGHLAHAYDSVDLSLLGYPLPLPQCLPAGEGVNLLSVQGLCSRDHTAFALLQLGVTCSRIAHLVWKTTRETARPSAFPGTIQHLRHPLLGLFQHRVSLLLREPSSLYGLA